MSTDQSYEITILPGTSRDGEKEGFDRIVIRRATPSRSSGRPARGNQRSSTISKSLPRTTRRRDAASLSTASEPPEDLVRDPAKKPIALITQNTRVIADLTVDRFLALHIRARDTGAQHLIARTVALANEFTGEKIKESMRMTSLSGGQTRSLLIADAILIGQTPILLLDEVENAGINKERVITCLRNTRRP